MQLDVVGVWMEIRRQPGLGLAVGVYKNLQLENCDCCAKLTFVLVGSLAAGQACRSLAATLLARS